MAGLLILDAGARVADNILNSSEDIVDGPFPQSVNRGRQIERIADANLQGNVKIIDDLEDGVGTSIKSHSFATGEKAYLNAIEQDARDVSRAPNVRIFGTDRYGRFRDFAPGTVKQAALVVAVPVNDSRMLLSPTFRAALRAYRDSYNVVIRVIPVRRWTRK